MVCRERRKERRARLAAILGLFLVWNFHVLPATAVATSFARDKSGDSNHANVREDVSSRSQTFKEINSSKTTLERSVDGNHVHINVGDILAAEDRALRRLGVNAACSLDYLGRQKDKGCEYETEMGGSECPAERPLEDENCAYRAWSHVIKLCK